MAEAESPTSRPSDQGPSAADVGETRVAAAPPDTPSPDAPASPASGGAVPVASFPEPDVAAAPERPPPGLPAVASASTHDRRRRVRWMDSAITLLLCGTAATVLLVATPPILRAAGVGATAKGPSAVDPARALRGAPGHRGEGQFFAGDDELEEEVPSPHRLRRSTDGDDDPVAPGERQGDAGVRVGFVRRPIKLFDHPGTDNGDVIGEVGSGETVMLVTEMGEWVLVVHSGSRDVSMGWTRKSDIAVR